MGKFNFTLRTNYVSKDGFNAVVAKYSSAGKIYQVNTGVEVLPMNWDSKNQFVIEDDPAATTKNIQLRTLRNKADKILLQAEVNGVELNTEEFKAAFSKPSDKNSGVFCDFLKKEIELKKSLLSYNTLRQYNATLNKIYNLDSRITIKEVNSFAFFQRFESYMRNDLSNQTNTVCKTLKILKALINTAVQKKLITRNEVNGYKLKYIQPDRNFLNLKEIDKLEKMLPTLPHRLASSLRCFLFCCYTGLRYGDLARLSFSHLTGKNIEIIQEKTSDMVKIPLSKRALKLIDTAQNKPEAKVFKVYSNQKMNDYLKAALLRAGIDREITFHCSRHTFATISLNINIPLNVVSKLLGHKDIKTTEIYARLLDETKTNEMKKWDKL
ncbi:MAG: site-specific integrase [Lentimicrobiaceae bacterium]|jgi:integrase|nr:site-specific integrase [Lentimicrobiaceae bacterium]